MGSFSVMASRIWDLYVTHSIVTGWWLSRINTYNTSLFCAWVVFLCDLVYIMDALARASKNSVCSGPSISFLFKKETAPWTLLETVISVLNFTTFVPFHVLVLLELDISGLYLIVCGVRLARLLQTGRIYCHVIWTISKLLKAGRLRAQEKRGTSLKATEKESWKKTGGTRVKKSPFLEHMEMLKAMELERRDWKRKEMCFVKQR